MKRLLRGLMVLGLFVDFAGPAKGEYVFTTLPDVPGAVGNTATFYGINDAGQIVGSYSDGTVDHGFLYSGGKYTVLDAPNSMYHTFATGINASGQIVGFYFEAGNQISHGFVLDRGGYIPTLTFRGLSRPLGGGLSPGALTRRGRSWETILTNSKTITTVFYTARVTTAISPCSARG